MGDDYLGSRRVFRCKNIIPIVLGSIGVGLLGAIIIPFWIWIIGIGAGFIIYAWYLFMDK
jgi:hypothetical protein